MSAVTAKTSFQICRAHVSGLACAWKVAVTSLNAPAPVYNAIALGSVLLFVVWVLLYLVKMIFYPKKVLKEWQCTLRGNSFVVPGVCLVLFGERT